MTALVNEYIVDRRALHDLRAGLRDGASAVDVERGAAEDVHDFDADVPDTADVSDEVSGVGPAPGGYHLAFRQLSGGGAFPVAGSAPPEQVFDELANLLSIGGFRCGRLRYI